MSKIAPDNVNKLIDYLYYFFADDKNCTLDGALDKLYCRSQMYLARQMSRLRPEMTMPMFSGSEDP